MKYQIVVLLAAVSAGVLLTFQNCSNVSFRTTKETPEQALAVISKNCTDASGVEHFNGDAWTTNDDATVKPVTCPDSGPSQQGYQDSTLWMCQSGNISIAGTDTKLVPPMAACPAPALTASASNAKPQTGGASDLLVTSQAVHDVKYDCRSVATGSSIFKGDLNVGTAKSALSPIVEDLKCSVSAQTASDPIVKAVDINVDCESSGKLKDPDSHMCIDFSCKSYVAITPANSNDGLKFEVPPRSVAGVCYTVKLMDAIQLSKSDKNQTHDPDVVSSNHTSGGTWNPWVMSRSRVEFLMKSGGGARQVRLSGSGQKAESIKVDNFVLAGLAKKAVGLSSNESYLAYGSKDSTVDGSHIKFRNANLPFKDFGAAGVTSIGSVDITTRVSTEESYLLDVRALDCGGSREMSDVYLLFQ